jgi:hypothetical protein
MKSKIQSQKSKTNPESQTLTLKRFGFGIWRLVFVSDFGFRISDFPSYDS